MRYRRTFVSLVVALAAGAGHAYAQAWVPPRGSLEVGLDYNAARSDQLLEDNGGKVPDAGALIQTTTLTGEYVVLDHLALDLGLPVEIIEYTGNKTAYVHPGGGRYDDGSFHTTLTDIRIGAHYQVLEDPIAASLIVAFSTPMASYETVGNAIAGRHLTGLHLGAAIGREITEALYAQGTYEFTLNSSYDRTPETAKFSQNTSDATVVIGYKLLEDRLDLNAGGNVHISHDGIDFSKFPSYPMNVQLYHDGVLRENMAAVGGGVGYRFNDTLALSLALRFFVWGVNTQNASVLGLALNWSAL